MLVCVLDREEPIAFSCFFGVVYGQHTVAAWCENEDGVGAGDLDLLRLAGHEKRCRTPLRDA